MRLLRSSSPSTIIFSPNYYSWFSISYLRIFNRSKMLPSEALAGSLSHSNNILFLLLFFHPPHVSPPLNPSWPFIATHLAFTASLPPATTTVAVSSVPSLPL